MKTSIIVAACALVMAGGSSASADSCRTVYRAMPIVTYVENSDLYRFDTGNTTITIGSTRYVPIQSYTVYSSGSGCSGRKSSSYSRGYDQGYREGYYNSNRSSYPTPTWYAPRSGYTVPSSGRVYGPENCQSSSTSVLIVH